MHIPLLSRSPLVVDLRYCSEGWVTSRLQKAARWVADRLPPLSEVLNVCTHRGVGSEFMMALEGLVACIIKDQNKA